MTIGKNEFITKIKDNSNFDKQTIQEVLEATLKAIKQSLQEGQDILLIGFGRFVLQESSERKGRNPRTGEVMTIHASKRVSFKPGKELKDAANPRKEESTPQKKKKDVGKKTK